MTKSIDGSEQIRDDVRRMAPTPAVTATAADEPELNPPASESAFGTIQMAVVTLDRDSGERAQAARWKFLLPSRGCGVN